MPFVRLDGNQKSGAFRFLDHLIWWMHQWRLPLFFIVCGRQFFTKTDPWLPLLANDLYAFSSRSSFAMMFNYAHTGLFRTTATGTLQRLFILISTRVAWNFIPILTGYSPSHLWFVASPVCVHLSVVTGICVVPLETAAGT